MEDKRTPTEVLIGVMEKFGEYEPNNLLVVWTAPDGMIAFDTVGETVTAIGMMEVLKGLIIKDRYRVDEE